MPVIQKIGDSFGAELLAAGVADGVSWNAITGSITIEPTKDAAYQAKVMAILAAHQPQSTANQLLMVQAKRASAYPSVGDQLDAIWKGGAAADEMKNKVLAVKLKYPKPV